MSPRQGTGLDWLNKVCAHPPRHLHAWDNTLQSRSREFHSLAGSAGWRHLSHPGPSLIAGSIQQAPAERKIAL